MDKFLEKRELVSFCLSDEQVKLPKRHRFMTKKVTNKNFREVRGVLPNGETHYYIAKFGGGLSMYAKYFDGQMEGPFRVRQGKDIKVEGFFKGGKPHGNFYFWSGKYIISTSTFVNGKVLEWSEWDSDGVVSRNKRGEASILEKNKSEEEQVLKTYLFSGKEYNEKQENINSKLHIRLPSEKFLSCFVRTKCFLNGETQQETETKWGGFFNDYVSAEVLTTYEERCPQLE
ncbi:hypothetical protein B1750_gp374 [Noumeavirus]|uniref:hypothetical protein n=1 Tax=Noumeavirus TaxID=1955558 RepID=UPI000982F415|nr:hypothetical protein B1750_gp374 [Noumeavirus]AQM73355.1 hypothetical protein NMV_374 [Noumeavirus]